MISTLVVGVGAAGNKAVVDAIDNHVVKEEDTLIINSTSKDFPTEYNGRKIVLSPADLGCGKERPVAKEYAKDAMSHGKFNLDNILDYETVIIITSVEGGTGSGATPIIAKFFQQVNGRNVHIIAFTGFEDDTRGLLNTVEFFKELNDKFVIETISNQSFMQEARFNKLKAEKLANKAVCEKLRVIIGIDMINGSQNIDDTDLSKLVNNHGYMVVEKKYIPKHLESEEDYDKVIKNMIYNSSSIITETPKANRLGVIFNLSEESQDAVDFKFSKLCDVFKKPADFIYETYTQSQWDGKREYIAFIASGLAMPLKEIEDVYKKYVASSESMDDSDEFFNKLGEMNMLEKDKKYDNIKLGEPNPGMSISDFLNNID